MEVEEEALESWLVEATLDTIEQESSEVRRVGPMEARPTAAVAAVAAAVGKQEHW